MTDGEFAQAVADFFRRKDYPFLGVEVKTDGPFPLVMLWDDDVLMTRIMACTVDENELENAACYASVKAAFEEVSGNAPCGVISCGVSPSGWREHE